MTEVPDVGLVTPKELAEACGRSISWARWRARLGKGVESRKVGGRWMIDLDQSLWALKPRDRRDEYIRELKHRIAKARQEA